MLFKNYDSIYFRKSGNIIKCSVKCSKNLGANIHMQLYTVHNLQGLDLLYSGRKQRPTHTIESTLF